MARGVADANALIARGANCSLSTNNVLNPFTPFGDCSLIRVANLYANVVQRGNEDELAECFEMLTNRSARLLRRDDYGIAPGRPADLVVWDARSPAEAVARIAGAAPRLQARPADLQPDVAGVASAVSTVSGGDAANPRECLPADGGWAEETSTSCRERAKRTPDERAAKQMTGTRGEGGTPSGP